MSDESWSRDEIDSPCVNVCVVHPSEGICVGCYRTLDEIAGWATMAPSERQSIMSGLGERAPRLRKRRGGRARRIDPPAPE